MENQGKRFITRFRKAHDLYGEYISLWDVKNFLMCAAWMALDKIDVHLSDEDILMLYGSDIFNEGKFRYRHNIIDLSPLLNEVDVNAGVVMSSLNKEMPGIGGAIEILEFIPDNMIFGGYDDLYLLAERDGAFIGSSDLPKYIEDQTVFKGRAVYDGLPVIAEGFVAIGIAGTTPAATAISFAVDSAN